MRRLAWLSVALALVIAYPLLFSTPFQQRLGALVLLYAIAASAWNIVGGYAGQVSVGHVVFFGCGAYAAMGAYAHFALSPLVGIPAGILFSVAIAAVIGVPTLRLSGHYFSMATIAVAELARLIVTNTDYLGAAVGLSGPTVARNVFDLSSRDVDLGQRAYEALGRSLEQPVLRHLREGGERLVPAPEHEERVRRLTEQAPLLRSVAHAARHRESIR